MMKTAWTALFLIASLSCAPAYARGGKKWITAWAASVQGPYPAGNPSAQPVLRFAFPSPEQGARDQTFRLIVKPDIWGEQSRVRLSNTFGTQSVTFDGVFAGLHLGGGAVVPRTNRTIRFGGKPAVTIAPGESVWSDPVTLRLGNNLQGRKLAISFHVIGESGPMTWHAKALQTSYLSEPGSGAKGHLEDESAFPFTTTSWYFLDAVDMMAPADTRLVVAFGDSITDGTASTLNGDDRWPDALSRRLHARFEDRVCVVNAGIGGNRVAGPAEYSPKKPFAGGPSALQRLDRDVLSLSGVSHLIWLEGINDFGNSVNSPVEAVQVALRQAVARIRNKAPGIRIIGATVISALGSTNAQHGSPAEDAKRQTLNEFIRNSKVFDAVIDFDKATRDPSSGELRSQFVPDSTLGGPGDKLHPNRAGYLAMAMEIDLDLLLR